MKRYIGIFVVAGLLTSFIYLYRDQIGAYTGAYYQGYYQEPYVYDDRSNTSMSLLSSDAPFNASLSVEPSNDEPYLPLSTEDEIRYRAIVEAYDAKMNVLSSELGNSLDALASSRETGGGISRLMRDVKIEEYQEAVLALTKHQLAEFNQLNKTEPQQISNSGQAYALDILSLIDKMK